MQPKMTALPGGLLVATLDGGYAIDEPIRRSIRQYLSGIPSIVALIVHGSYAIAEATRSSDLDLLAVVDSLGKDVVDYLDSGRKDLAAELGIDVALNVHTSEELRPMLRRVGLFAHRNRAEMFVLKTKYQSQLIYGESPLGRFADPRAHALRCECVKVLHSFSYFLKKYLFNPTLAPHGLKEFIRIPLICSEYVAAFHGYVPLGYRDALAWLNARQILVAKDFEVVTRLVECRQRALGDVSRALQMEVIATVSGWARQLVDAQLRHGMSDWRLYDGAAQISCNLDLPQVVAMAVVPGEENGSILVVQRSEDDYLSPGSWSLPGGYVNEGEDPEHAVTRELYEELGLRLDVRPLFGRKPVLSDRCAVFAFEVTRAIGVIRHLSEYANYAFCHPGDARQFTSEARLVLSNWRLSGDAEQWASDEAL